MFLLRKILLPLLLLFIYSGVFGHATTRNFAATLSLDHPNHTNGFSRSSLEKKGEMLPAIAHTVYVAQQHTSAKLLSGYLAMHTLQGPDTLQAGLFSFTSQSAYRYSSHLLLIFPFHYFW